MTATATEPAALRGDERAAWLALIVVLGATVMVALDTTIVNIALDRIGEELGGGNVEWVISAYLLAVCATQPASGWLANTFGHRRVLLTGLAVFTTASLACAAAPNLGVLVAARVIQGLGGGAIMPVGMALVLGLFPRHRHGRAISIWGMAVAVAPAVGPTIGGWLVTSISWHWLFLVNGPIGAVTLIAGWRLLPELGERTRDRFDLPGLALGSGGLTLFVLGLSEADGWGWGSPAAVACIGGGIASLLGFVYWELRVDKPLIELRMFNDRSFRLAISALVFVYIAHYGRLVFIPLQLEGLRDQTPLAVGMLFLPAGAVSALAMGIGGRMVDRAGARLPVTIGCVVMCLAAIGFATLTLDTPLWLIALYMCINGFGMGILTAPAMIAGISDLPRHLVPQGTAVRSLMGQVSGALSVAILGAIIAARSGTDPSPATAQDAYNAAFWVAAAGVVVSIVLAARLPRAMPRPAPAGAALSHE